MAADAMDELWLYRNILTTHQPPLTNFRHQKWQPAAYKNKRPPRLTIFTGQQPLFQLQQQQTPRAKLRSHASSPSIYTLPLPESRKVKKKVKSYKSLSELETYEHKGLVDLGFNPNIISMVKDLDEETSEKKAIRRPYLSEAWLVSKPGLPVMNLRVLNESPEGTDMKNHIKFWARSVAMLVHGEA